ncbi:MAG: HAD family phosphatase [Phycisphaerales bacterium]|nr:MAG: HAD family phosphatase [Phycisphaerales bacterium]
MRLPVDGGPRRGARVLRPSRLRDAGPRPDQVGPDPAPRHGQAADAQRGRRQRLRCSAVADAAYDILALDLDGTLLRSDKRIAERDMHAVREAGRAGVRVVICTARPPRSVRPIIEALGLLDAPTPKGDPGVVTINYNGAAIWDVRRSRAVEHLPIESGLARGAVESARKALRDVMVSIEILDKWYTDKVDVTLHTETSRAFAPDFVGPLDAFLRVPATKVMFLAQPERLVAVRDALHDRYARKGLLDLKISDDHLFSIIAPGVDKSTALATLCARLGATQERVLAIGDAPNDAKMLEWAGRGVAVSNAWAEAKNAADEVLTLSNDQCAVAHVIEREILAHT